MGGLEKKVLPELPNGNLLSLENYYKLWTPANQFEVLDQIDELINVRRETVDFLFIWTNWVKDHSGRTYDALERQRTLPSRMWDANQPQNRFHSCVVANTNGLMKDVDCNISVKQHNLRAYAYCNFNSNSTQNVILT